MLDHASEWCSPNGKTYKSLKKAKEALSQISQISSHPKQEDFERAVNDLLANLEASAGPSGMVSNLECFIQML